MGQYNINTPEFRVSFNHMFDGKENDAGKVKFGCTMLFAEGETLKHIKAMATTIMVDKFGEDKTKWPKKFHKPWQDQSKNDAENEEREGKPYDGYKSGNLMLNCMSAEDAPEVVDQKLQAVIEKRKVYSGCWGIGNIDLFWFEAKNKQGVVTNKGITSSLNCFQKTRDDAPLGGGARPQASAVFKPIAVDTKKGAAAVFAEDDEDDEDPMA